MFQQALMHALKLFILSAINPYVIGLFPSFLKTFSRIFFRIREKVCTFAPNHRQMTSAEAAGETFVGKQ